MKKRTKGNGTVYYDKTTETWRGSIIIGTNPKTGKPIHKCVNGATKKEAEDKLNQLKKKLDKGTKIWSKVTIVDLIKERDEYDYLSRKIRESTAERRKNTLKAISKYAISQKPISKVTENDIKAFYLQIANDYSNNVIKKIYSSINYAFKEAVRQKIIDDNIVFGNRISKPNSYKNTRLITALTLEEEKELIAALEKEIKEFNYSPKNRYISYATQAMLMLFTGMRAGEVNALSFNDIDLSKGVIQINHSVSHGMNDNVIISKTKTAAGTREIYVGQNIIGLISYYMPKLGTKAIVSDIDGVKINLLFFDKAGNPIATPRFNDWLKRFAKRNNIGSEVVTTHRLRHTYATRCVDGGMAPQTLQKLLGHTNISVTMDTYYHSSLAEKQKAVNANEEFLTQNGISFDISED